MTIREHRLFANQVGQLMTLVGNNEIDVESVNIQLRKFIEHASQAPFRFKPSILVEPVKFLDLSIRAQNLVKSFQALLVGELVLFNRDEVAVRAQSRPEALEELESALTRYGLSFGMPLSADLKEGITNKLYELSHPSPAG